MLLLILAQVVYFPAADGPFIWDDDDYVSNNPTLATADGLSQIWFKPNSTPQYYPLVFTTFWIEHHLWGDWPAGYRQVNILLHGASAIMIWRLLRALKLPGALAAAAIFAVHPVMAESVAWVTERKNTLSLLFCLLALTAYLRYAEILFVTDVRDAVAGGPKLSGVKPAKPRWRIYAIALGLFVLALLSKTVTATLPAAVLVILWWKRGRLCRRDVYPLLPFFVLGIGASMVTGYLERTHVGASGPEFNLSVAQRVLIAGRAAWFYLAKLLWPAKLSFIYPRWEIDPAIAWQWVFPIALLLALVILALLVKRIGRGPLAVALLYLGTLLPALGFFNVFPMRYSFVADHFQYHAAIAIIAGITALAALAVKRGAPAGRQRAISVSLATGVAVVLGGAALLRAEVFAGPWSLWEDALAKNPRSWMVWTQIGKLAAEAVPPQMTTARKAYTTAYELSPDNHDTLYNMGRLAIEDNQLDSARNHFERAISIEPRYAAAHDMLGYVLSRQGQHDRALQEYQAAVRLAPHDWRAQFNLGLALKDQQQLSPAIEHLLAAANLQPQKVAILEHLADACRRAGRKTEALTAYERITRLQPDNAEAHFNLGLMLILAGQRSAAEPHLAKAFSLKPELRGRLPR